MLDDLVGRKLKAGDEIAGIVIKRIKPGSVDKTAIIGRKMANHVEETAFSLKSKGFNVEIFNKTYQKNNVFEIDGRKLTWDDLEADFSDLSKYKRDAKGYILEEDLPNTLMYKANKQWADKLVNEGYEVIDVGYPKGLTSKSLFYEMEVETIF